MSKVLSLFYWNGRPNAGDYFGHYFCEKHGITVNWTNKNPTYAIVGSILNSKYLANSHIWGCGLHKDTERPSRDPKLIHAVRGHLTAQVLGLSNVAFGDTGILASTVYNASKIRKTNKFGLIAHYVDEEYFTKYAPREFKLISMASNNIEKILAEINSCEFIFSSSLHGIIFSHSFGIPAMHVIHQSLYDINQFKFRDYYSNFSIPYIPKIIDSVPFFSSSELNTLYSSKRKFVPSSNEIKRMQSNLLNACPFKELL